MEIAALAVFFVVVLISASIVGGRIGIAAPLLLVVVGVGIGYLPIVPPVHVNPEIILVGVLPPLLYSAAVNTPLIDMRRNLRPIVGLSVVLVIISALTIGALLHLIIPEVPFPVAVALGAVVSPTDAVAATSIGKRLGMPERLVSILEGESLVNDATSLVLLKTALAAIAGSFAFWNAAGSFAFSVTVAIIIGYLIGVATVWLRSKFKNPVYDTVVSFVVPFVAFVPAEAAGASGVLAVVVTGLYTGHHAVSRFSATARMNERLNWRTIQFIIENGVFLLMGLELHALAAEVGGHDLRFEHLPIIALGITAVLIATRAFFMAPLLFSMRGNLTRYEMRGTGLQKRAAHLRSFEETTPGRLHRVELLKRRNLADLKHEKDQRLGWRDGTVLSWSGMRGVVTLAAAQSISTDVPFRAQLVLIAFFVAAITLLLHGLTLPWLLRRLWPDGTGSGQDFQELEALSIDLVDAGDDALDQALASSAADDSFPPPSEHVIDRVRSSAINALAPLTAAIPLESAVEPGATPPLNHETAAEAYLRLSRIVLEAQRDALLEERAIGRYSSSALRKAGNALDAHETRLPPVEH